MSLSDSNKKPTQLLDVRGRLCPMNFVYTKVTLEQMNKGEVLEVLVDFPPAVESISDSCERQSLAEVLNTELLNTDKKEWKIILRRI